MELTFEEASLLDAIVLFAKNSHNDYQENLIEYLEKTVGLDMDLYNNIRHDIKNTLQFG